jgi:hypothetical protein
MPWRVLALVFLASVVLGGVSAAARTATPAPAVTVLDAQAKTGSVTIRWHATPRSRIYAEVGLDEEYGIWARPTKAGPSGEGVVRFGGLDPVTSYRFRVIATYAGRRVEATGSFRTLAIPSWSGATANANALVIDGQRFFPRMVWRYCPWEFPQALEAGINLFMGTECQGPEAFHERLAGRGYFVPDAEEPVEGRGVIGFHLPDEADLVSSTADSLPVLPKSAVSRRVPFLTLSNHFYSRADPSALPVGRGIYPGLVAHAEMVGFDLYPLQSWCNKETLPAVHDAQRELIELADGKPTYQWIEAGQMEHCLGLEPSPAIVRAETWLAISGGARGIGYFPGDWRPAVAAEIRRTNDQIASLAPALLAPEAPLEVDRADLVKFGARRLNGATYVVAANSSFQRRRATFRVPGLTAKTVRVFGEGRTVKVRNGRITDAFRGLAVHIYIADPSVS